jgi:hypothetical protein
MKVHPSLDGKPLEPFEIPVRWPEVDFEMFLKLQGVQVVPSKILSVITGLDEPTIARCQIVGLNSIISALSFMNPTTGTPMSNALPKSILGHEIPKDLTFQQTGRYEDALTVAASIPEKPTKEDLMKYLRICAIWTMPNYIESTIAEKDEFEKKFLKAPCEEVMAIGNFTLVKCLLLSRGSEKLYPLADTRLNKWRLALKVFRIKLAFMARYYGWKARHRITGIKFSGGQ